MAARFVADELAGAFDLAVRPAAFGGRTPRSQHDYGEDDRGDSGNDSLDHDR
jgi:hypothetical protein